MKEKIITDTSSVVLESHLIEGNTTSDILDNVATSIVDHAQVAYSHAETLSHHLSDAVLWHFSFMGFPLDITKRVVMMWIISALLLLTFIPLARRLTKKPFTKPTRFFGFLEVLITFVRKDIVQSAMGSTSKKYDPFLLTMFFFILFSNLLGLIPSPTEITYVFGEIFGFVAGHHGHDALSSPLMLKIWPVITATGDISVTLILSLFIFLALWVTGFAFQGVAFVKNIVPKGIPVPMWLIMWPIELIGLIVKPVALSIRLLANMTAGHMIILVLFGFIFQFVSYFVVPLSLLGGTAIYLLEIFVAFLQAYIFVFLSSLFIGQVQHRH